MAENVNQIDKEIARRLAGAREEAGLIKADMADRLKITKQGYTPWEAGEHIFTANDLIQLSKIVGRSVDWLMGIETQYPPEVDELVHSYISIRNPALRRLALGHVRAVAEVREDQPSSGDGGSSGPVFTKEIGKG